MGLAIHPVHELAVHPVVISGDREGNTSGAWTTGGFSSWFECAILMDTAFVIGLVIGPLIGAFSGTGDTGCARIPCGEMLGFIEI